MNKSGAQRVQCVCGEEVPLENTQAEAIKCTACGRVIPTNSAHYSLSLERTFIADPQAFAEPDVDIPAGPGDQLDHFSVLELMGAGGMGAVFRARDESLLRFVALKVIRGSRNSHSGQRLIEEARAQARVQHPNIVHIYYVGVHNDCPFFAMELIDGPSLARLSSERRLDFIEIAEIGQQVAIALRHSARNGIIHGDVKPANIMLEGGTTVKLSDFGLAHANATDKADQKQTGPQGTLSYMAPEVASGQQADELSDVYSLGVMLYELTFGTLPDEDTPSSTLMEKLEQRKRAELTFPTEWPEDRPERWKEFLERILQPDRNQRFQDYDTLIAELRRWLPYDIVPAGRFARMCSWFVDWAVTGVIAGLAAGGTELLCSALKQANNYFFTPAIALAAIPLLWLCVRFGKTPGKSLTQLKTVDHFGLRPSHWKLWIKYGFTYWVLFASGITGFLEALLSSVFGPDSTVGVMSNGSLYAILSLGWLVNAGWLIVSGGRRSLVDYMLGLQVILDTDSTRPA